MLRMFQKVKYSLRLQKSNSGVVNVVVGGWAVYFIMFSMTKGEMHF